MCFSNQLKKSHLKMQVVLKILINLCHPLDGAIMKNTNIFQATHHKTKKMESKM